MKKQIKLTLLGTMLFTGALSLHAENEGTPKQTVTAPAVQKPAATPQGSTVTVGEKKESAAPEAKIEAPATDASTTEGSKVEGSADEKKSESFLSNVATNVKNFVTNKWVLGTGAVVVGAYVAFRIYQAYTDEEAEAEQPLV